DVGATFTSHARAPAPYLCGSRTKGSVGRVGLDRPDEVEQCLFRHRPLDAELAAAAGDRKVVPNYGGRRRRADLHATTASMVSQEELDVSQRAHTPPWER